MYVCDVYLFWNQKMHICGSFRIPSQKMFDRETSEAIRIKDRMIYISFETRPVLFSFLCDNCCTVTKEIRELEGEEKKEHIETKALKLRTCLNPKRKNKLKDELKKTPCPRNKIKKGLYVRATRKERKLR